MIKVLLCLLLSSSEKPRNGQCETSADWYCLTRQCTTVCKKLTCCAFGVCTTTNASCKKNPDPPVVQQ